MLPRLSVAVSDHRRQRHVHPRLLTNNERQCGPTLRDRSQEAVDFANDIVQKTRHIVDSADQQWVEIQRLEDPAHDVNKMAKSNHKFQLGIYPMSANHSIKAFGTLTDVNDRQIHFADGDIDSSIQRDERGDTSIEVQLG